MTQTTQNAARKPLKTIQELQEVLREDCYYFIAPIFSKDTYYLRSLKKILEQKHNGKIVFVIKPSLQVVFEIFADEDYIVCENSVIELFSKTPECFKFDGVVSTPTLGKLFATHPELLQKQITTYTQVC